MNRKQWLTVGCALLFFVLLGCKMTELTVINDTERDAQVSLQGPGDIEPKPAVLPIASNGKGVFKIQTPSEKLPANYEWNGAGRNGTLLVGKDSPTQRFVHLATSKESAVHVDIESKDKGSTKVYVDEKK